MTLKNSGAVAGKEVMQVYVHECEPQVSRPPRELRAFAKVGLEPGEQKTVRFLLNRRDFAWYDVDSRDWVVTPGRFEIQAGGSSRDLPLTLAVDVQARQRTRKPLTRDSMIQEFRDRHNGEALYAELVRAMGFGDLTRPSEPTPGLTSEQLAAKRKADSAVLAFVNEMPIYTTATADPNLGSYG